jgi:hypothetical protein
VDRRWWGVALSLSGCAVVRRVFWQGFEEADLGPDVLGGALAEGDLVTHLESDVLDVVVYHGQGHADGDYRYNAECYRGEGHKFVSLVARVGLHITSHYGG